MPDVAMTTELQDRFEATARRLAFAAWPQTYAHPSWFDELDAAVGLPVSRRSGRDVGPAEQAVAQVLLGRVGAGLHDRVGDESVPSWAMQAHRSMRDMLSVVAALSVLPLWRLAVSAADVGQWDAVLGVGVRHAALRLWKTDPRLEPPAAASALLRLNAREASATAADWERFCLRLGLTALATYSAGVRARVRLAWPAVLRDTEPLPSAEGLHRWVAEACEQASRWLPPDAHPGAQAAP
jgi:hypothetical protein